jgi:hypothetical protein
MGVSAERLLRFPALHADRKAVGMKPIAYFQHVFHWQYCAKNWRFREGFYVLSLFLIGISQHRNLHA